MNATDNVATDLSSDRAYVLDVFIEGFKHIIPVFDERQMHRGVKTRNVWAFTSVLEIEEQRIASTTQNTRRKEIIPTTPRMSILKEAAMNAERDVHLLYQRECASESIDAKCRRSLIEISLRQLRNLLKAISRLESHWGSFHIWIKQPKRALCESLIQAWQKAELDSGEFLVWFREKQLLLQGPELDPYIAQVLLGMRVTGGRLMLPGDLQNLADLNDHETYTAIVRKARARKRADEDTRQDRVRFTVEHDAAGNAIRRYAESLDDENRQGIALKDRLPDITCDPIEFLCSSRQPIKLVDLAGMRSELAGDVRWAGLKLTLDEYRYVRLHHGYEMTQNEVGQYLNWDVQKLRAVRRNADLKVGQRRGMRAVKRPNH